MARAISRAGLVKKLDRAFSRFIRKQAADIHGFVECVTCGSRIRWEEAHAGHFISRRFMALRWDPRNVHPQDAACNTFRAGAIDEYSRFILDKYGRETFDELLSLKRETKKWSKPELLDLLEQYEER
jgi:hypothetical protein